MQKTDLIPTTPFNDTLECEFPPQVQTLRCLRAENPVFDKLCADYQYLGRYIDAAGVQTGEVDTMHLAEVACLRIRMRDRIFMTLLRG